MESHVVSWLAGWQAVDVTKFNVEFDILKRWNRGLAQGLDGRQAGSTLLERSSGPSTFP